MILLLVIWTTSTWRILALSLKTGALSRLRTFILPGWLRHRPPYTLIQLLNLLGRPQKLPSFCETILNGRPKDGLSATTPMPQLGHLGQHLVQFPPSTDFVPRVRGRRASMMLHSLHTLNLRVSDTMSFSTSRANMYHRNWTCLRRDRF